MDEDDCKGWLLTCDQNREKNALKDAYNFLNQYIEEIYDEDFVSEAISKKLKQQNKELSLENELKETKKFENKLLFSIDTKVKCTVFVKINPTFKQIDPVLVVYRMMEDVCLRNKDITRFCHKILPAQRVFKAQHFKMLQVVDDMFCQKSKEGEIRSWALNFKCRNNSKFNYKEVLRETEKIAAKYGHFVDIYYPQWTLSIEITHHLMCVSISEKFKEYNEYKLHRKIPQQQREKRFNKQKPEQEEAEKDKQKFEQKPKKEKSTKEQNADDSVEQSSGKQEETRRKLQHEVIQAAQEEEDVDLI